MYKTIIIILVLVGAGLLFAQAPLGIDGEIIPETINAAGKTYKFEIKPVSGKTTWCRGDYPTWYIVTNASVSNREISGNSCWDNSYVFDSCLGSPGQNPIVWETFNEFTIFKQTDPYWQEIISFYIDYRDCRYGLQGQDIAILVDGDNDKVYYAPDEGPSDCDISEFTEITDGETLKIWEVNEYSGSRDVSCMCAIPSIISITSYNDHPKITWSHDDDPNGTYNYQVWRLLTKISHPIGTWYLINTTSNKYYIDSELYIGDGSWGRAYYKIRANIDDLYSSYSGYDYINFEGFQKTTEQITESREITDFKLGTNYPNPFNPETEISFTLPENSSIILKVFDINGKNIATLSSGIKESGTHTVQFKSSNLPSGIYIYHLKAVGLESAKSFNEAKQMLLIR